MKQPTRRASNPLRRRWLLAALTALTAMLAGCVHAPAVVQRAPAPPRAGEVGVSEITALVPVASRLVIADSETFFMPLASHDNALPTYPAPLLGKRLPPQTACLRVSIDSAGAVIDSAPVSQPPTCPGAGAIDPQFLAATMTVVRGWRFDPAVRCEFPTLQAQQLQDCSGGHETPQAVSLAYRFVFEHREGRGSVRLSAGAE